MAQKDISEKSLENLNDVFSDIANVLLFNGRQLIGEDELEDALPKTQYKADGKLHEQERDVAKYWKSGMMRMAYIGAENQTAIDPDMPLRFYGYDGSAYRQQLLLDRRDENGTVHRNPRYPVVSMLLYFGNKRWKKPKTLMDCMDVPKALLPFINDYRMNIFEIAWLTDEQVQLFKSDFRIVADYFVQKRQNNDYIPKPDTIRHVDQVLKFLAAMSGDSRFEDILNDMQGRRPKNMCEVLDRIEARGISIGEARGEARGISIGEARGEARGISIGELKGENMLSSLIQKLLAEGDTNAIAKVTSDDKIRKEYYIKYGIVR